MGTKFSEVYNRFLDKITDDLYMELTPEDTVKDLQHMLIDALPAFEFPRINLFDYTISTTVMAENEIGNEDFILGMIWNDIETDELIDGIQYYLIEHSSFNFDLTSEEINILAILMMCAWVQRQLTSIENTRMKYSGPDFKMTSQANHMQKLITLLTECVRQSHHSQRLYKRRRIIPDGRYRSNWDVFDYGVYGRGRLYPKEEMRLTANEYLLNKDKDNTSSEIEGSNSLQSPGTNVNSNNPIWIGMMKKNGN